MFFVKLPFADSRRRNPHEQGSRVETIQRPAFLVWGVEVTRTKIRIGSGPTPKCPYYFFVNWAYPASFTNSNLENRARLSAFVF